MSPPRVKLIQGEVEGKSLVTSEGFKYNCFQGIPYGKPPVGKLRFKDPHPAGSWVGVRDGTKEGNTCPQIDPFQGETVTGNEDCLFLNVYTPERSDSGPLLPVMVWIHGGGFYKGSGNYSIYGPDFIIEKNVVYVAVNYRFAVLGFLCLDTPAVPGNAGLKDQILSLRWIQNNIKHFGGDANNVTIFGESAGAASIHYLSLSPLARGLFQKAIIQSGSALCQWAIQPDPLPNVFNLAASLGCDDSDVNNVLSFLQNVPLNDLLNHGFKAIRDEDYKRYLPCAFLPVVEKRFEGIESIINEDPEDIITSGNFANIPLMAGYSSKESVFMFDKISCDTNRIFELINDFQYFVPSKLKVAKDSEKALSAANKIKKFYFKDNNVSCETVHDLIDMLSDFLFRHAVDLTVKLLAKHSGAPVYYFQFSYLGNLNKYKANLAKLNVKGASHSEENGYIFKKEFLRGVEVTPSDNLVRKRLVQMWTDFAKYGNPTPNKTDCIDAIWKPATDDTTNYLEINEVLTPGTNPNSEALSFWIRLREGLLTKS